MVQLSLVKWCFPILTLKPFCFCLTANAKKLQQLTRMIAFVNEDPRALSLCAHIVTAFPGKLPILHVWKYSDCRKGVPAVGQLSLWMLMLGCPPSPCTHFLQLPIDVMTGLVSILDSRKLGWCRCGQINTIISKIIYPPYHLKKWKNLCILLLLMFCWPSRFDYYFVSLCLLVFIFNITFF